MAGGCRLQKVEINIVAAEEQPPHFQTLLASGEKGLPGRPVTLRKKLTKSPQVSSICALARRKAFIGAGLELARCLLVDDKVINGARAPFMSSEPAAKRNT